MGTPPLWFAVALIASVALQAVALIVLAYYGRWYGRRTRSVHHAIVRHMQEMQQHSILLDKRFDGICRQLDALLRLSRQPHPAIVMHGNYTPPDNHTPPDSLDDLDAIVEREVERVRARSNPVATYREAVEAARKETEA